MMARSKKAWLSLGYLYFSLVLQSTICIAKVPEILLANVYHQGIDVQSYLISEKLDGVRAIWDGQQLVTRQGHPIRAPAWFIKDFPKTALDGELWAGRGQFDRVTSAIQKSQAEPQVWESIAYYVFELPDAGGHFAERVKQLQVIVQRSESPYLKVVHQFKVPDHNTLKQKLDEVVRQHGEGLMLHRADASYITGRSDVLLKLKPQLDAEARVIAYVPGKGKYQGKMGALLLETPAGLRFKLGTGFSDAERAKPPPIGSIVTYIYRDITKTGKPKFASFLRVRPPE